MGVTLSRALRADGYASPTATSGSVERSDGGSPQCAHGAPTFAFVDADAESDGVRVLRARMLAGSPGAACSPRPDRVLAEGGRLPSPKLLGEHPDEVAEVGQTPRRKVPPLRLGALAGALGAALPKDIGPACAVICTPPQDRILEELGLPADPAWPPSRAADYQVEDD